MESGDCRTINLLMTNRKGIPQKKRKGLTTPGESWCSGGCTEVTFAVDAAAATLIPGVAACV